MDSCLKWIFVAYLFKDDPFKRKLRMFTFQFSLLLKETFLQNDLLEPPNHFQVLLLSCLSLLFSYFLSLFPKLISCFLLHLLLFFVCHFSRLLEGQKAQRSWSYSLSGYSKSPPAIRLVGFWAWCQEPPALPSISTSTGVKLPTNLST